MSYKINPHYKLVKVDLTDNTSVADSGGTNTQTLQPPVGKIYQVVDIIYKCPSPGGTSSGTHEINIFHPDTKIGDYYSGVRGKSAHGDAIAIHKACVTATTQEVPSSEREQWHQIRNIICSNEYEVSFEYTNDTDVANAQNRQCYVLAKEFSEIV